MKRSLQITLLLALKIGLSMGQARSAHPNVIFIYTDDQGKGTLSYEGVQDIIRTPHIDFLARHGLRLENNYGAMFCAPARASMLTGFADLRKNKFVLNRGGIYIDYLQGRLPMEQVQATIDSIEAGEQPGTVLPQVFKKAGYVTGEIGKLEWGFAVSYRQMKDHSWDYYYGYLDHRMCHGFYPMSMFENGREIPIPGNRRPDAFVDSAAFRQGPVYPRYAEDLYMEKVRSFIIRNKDKPFFLYFPTNLPHGPVSAPAIDPAFAGNSRLTHDQQLYATMVKIVDNDVGAITRLVDSLGLSKNTIIVFGSDNGHHLYYEGRQEKVDNITTKFLSDNGGDVFNGNDSLAGLKTTNWEGGVRVPLVYYWPGTIPSGIVSTRVTANYDILPTMADLLHVKVPDRKDGLSYLSELYGKPFPGHDYVVFSSMLGPALVTRTGWKLRTYLLDGRQVLQLYDLNRDRREDHDLSAQFPDTLNRLRSLLLRECDGDFRNGIYDFAGSPATEIDDRKKQPPRKPNIVLLLTDDAGYADFSFQSDRLIPTPHVDRIANEGVKFTNAYVTGAVCSPSRAGILTGINQAEFGHVYNFIKGVDYNIPADSFGLPLRQKLIGDYLKPLGYTTGIIGKWHEGIAPRFHPGNRGFDYFWGFLWGSSAYTPGQAKAILENEHPVPGDSIPYLTDAIGDESLRFIQTHADTPFFLYVAFNAPHTPMQAKPEILDRFRTRFGSEGRALNAAMTYSIDQNVGRILDKLSDLGLLDNTLIVFTNDNGGQVTYSYADNYPLRGMKGDVYEGGIRVPMALMWRGRIKPGTVCETPVTTLDFLPTFLDAAGGNAGREPQLEGTDLRTVLGQAPNSAERTLYWYVGLDKGAIRLGDWKLDCLPGKTPELYNLRTDIGETHNLYQGRPDIARQLYARYRSWKDALPVPGWIPVKKEDQLYIH